MAKRYSKLPTEILESGTTLDLKIAEIAVGYETYLSKNPQQARSATLNSNYSQEELKAMIDSVKEK